MPVTTEELEEQRRIATEVMEAHANWNRVMNEGPENWAAVFPATRRLGIALGAYKRMVQANHAASRAQAYRVESDLATRRFVVVGPTEATTRRRR